MRIALFESGARLSIRLDSSRREGGREVRRGRESVQVRIDIWMDRMAEVSREGDTSDGGRKESRSSR